MTSAILTIILYHYDHYIKCINTPKIECQQLKKLFDDYIHLFCTCAKFQIFLFILHLPNFSYK